MLWEPGKPLIWTLQIHGFPTHRVAEGEVGVWVCGDYRKQGEGGVRGNDMWEVIQDTETSASVLWKKSKGGTTFTEVRGVKVGIQSESSTSPISKSEMVESASVTGRFHSSRANTHA